MSPRTAPLPWLLLVTALGLALRLHVAFTAPWYWDEGYVAELALSLLHGARPQACGLWHDGFFPLSTSPLVPLSAVPFVRLPFWDALSGVRVWAALLDSACIVLLWGLGRRLQGQALGLLAAAAYAVLPFAVQHGGRGFYHHLAVAFIIYGVWRGAVALESGERRDAVAAGLSLGFAVATCYWTWPLAAAWAACMAWRQTRRLPLLLACLGLFPLMGLGAAFWPDPAGAQWSLKGLLLASRIAGPADTLAFGRALAADLSGLSFLALGLAGLALASWAEPKRWGWPALALLLALLEPLRQRGSIQAMAYPYQMAAPLAALGLAYLALQLWGRAAFWGRAAAIAVGLLWLRPHPTANLDAWSCDPARTRELAAFFESRPAGDLVCGLPNFNWRLLPHLRVSEPNVVAVAEGRQGGNDYLAGAPASRLSQPATLAQVRYAVVSRIHFLGVFVGQGAALTFLEMERQGWPLAFDNRSFRVYENPKFGAKPDPKVAILQSPENYALAAAQAHFAGRADAERYAQQRALALGYKP